MASDSSKQPPGRIAGIDYGTVRMGIALSDPERILASPCENYTRRGQQQDAERMRPVVDAFRGGRARPTHLLHQDTTRSECAEEEDSNADA